MPGRAVVRIGTLALCAGCAPLLANGPVLEDRHNRIYIPAEPEQVWTLKVGAVYNDDDFQLRYEFETDAPSWYHQYWIREDGEWVRYGTDSAGPDPHGFYEDRISMMLDDGGVEGFARYGGVMTVHDGVRSMIGAVSPEEVAEHPYLGEELGRSDVRKYLPETRDAAPDEPSWDQLRSTEALQALRAEGGFLDLWQWRAHRSHPVGHADNTYVFEYRLSSEGQGPYTGNWDDEADQPRWMFDPDQTGKRALRKEKLLEQGYGQDDLYYLSEAHATEYDPDHEWQEGDAIPQRFLREPTGSRGAIRAGGGYEDGAWRIRLTRSLAAPNAEDSKALAADEVYSVAFAVHNRAGARWHRVSLPLTLGLGVEADIVAQEVNGDLDDAAVEWTEVKLHYPGQVTWQWLNSDHTGAELVRAGELSVDDIHQVEELAERVVEHELERYRRAVEPSD